MENIHNFLDFCRIHGFFPMIDKIYFDKQDISNIKELYWIVELALKKRDFSIFRLLYQEIDKFQDINNILLQQILQIVQYVSEYTMNEYQNLLWNKVEKLKNPWVISENIFVELAMRMENEIRKTLNIFSTYIQLASYKADTEKKQDMIFLLKKTPNQNYQNIPIQFTTWKTITKKTEDIQSMLFEKIKQEDPQKNIQEYNNFCIISVNWRFRDAIQWKLTNDYQKWVKNPLERETTWSGKQFPFFIDRIDPEILEPAKVMYIALHMLMKKYNFKNTNNEKYLTSLRKEGKINKSANTEIDGIDISKILVKNTEIKQKIKRVSKEWIWSLQKYSTEIWYNDWKVWNIVMFSL